MPTTSDLLDLPSLAERLAPSIVGLGRGARGGSGVIVGPGLVATLWRNLHGADSIGVLLHDGARASARVAGADRAVDLAILRLDADPGLPAASWSRPDADPLRIGAPVAALADPFGSGLRATAGAVASLPRAVRGPGGRLIEGAIEHTAPLPRGSGGGPLVDASGAIVGLNAVRQAGGFLLAWPSTVLVPRAARLAGGEGTAPPTLGVALAGPRQTRRLRASLGLPEIDGLLVRAVAPDSPAARAGVTRGDVIVAAAQAPIARVDDLFAAIDAAFTGDTGSLALELVRGTEPRTLTVTTAPATGATR